MRTSERYLKRIAIPLVAVGLIAVTGNMIYNALNPDETPEQSESVPPATEQKKTPEAPFSPQMVEKEVAAFKLSLAELDQALKRGGSAAPNQQEQDLEALRSRVESHIEKLRAANPENWEERREAAYNQLETFASAIGEEIRSEPSEPAR